MAAHPFTLRMEWWRKPFPPTIDWPLRASAIQLSWEMLEIPASEKGIIKHSDLHDQMDDRQTESVTGLFPLYYIFN